MSSSRTSNKPELDLEVLAEWESLAFQYELGSDGFMHHPPGTRGRYGALYDRCRDESDWRVEASTAAIIGGSCGGQAIIDRDYLLAIDVFEQVLAHPGVSALERSQISSLQISLAAAYLMSGDVTRATQIWLEVLSDRPRERKIVSFQIASALETISDKDPGGLFDRRLLPVLELMRIRSKRLDAILLGREPTNLEIVKLLEAAH